MSQTCLHSSAVFSFFFFFCIYDCIMRPMSICFTFTCSVLKVKLANIKLLFINFETVTTDENNSIKKQFFQTVTVYVYINTAKIIDGKCNNPSQSQHDVACFTTIPNIQLMIPVTNAIHVCKHTKISLHICIHALYTKSFGMCIEGKNLKGTLDL